MIRKSPHVPKFAVAAGFCLLSAVLALTFSACSAPQAADPPPASPTASDPAVSGEAGAGSSASAMSSAESAADPPAQASSPASSAPASSSAAPTAAVPPANPLRGDSLELGAWQWVDNRRMLIASVERGDTVRALLYDSETETAELLLEKPGSAQDTSSLNLDSAAVLLIGSESYALDKPDGERLSAFMLDETADLLPKADGEYTYGGFQLSSDEDLYFYERYGSAALQGERVGDRLIVDTNRQGAEKHPVAEIAYPFDIRDTPKNLRFIRGADRILVEARLPKKDSYDEIIPTYYIYNASTGALTTQFTLEDPTLQLLDAQGAKLLFEKTGEDYALFVYDWKTGALEQAVKLEGQKRAACSARFSPDGARIALLRKTRDLTPELFPLQPTARAEKGGAAQ